MIGTSTESLAIALLSKAEINHGADLMASTFATDPLGCYLLPDARSRLDIMSWYWCEALRHSFPHGHTYTTTPKILGIASWLPPGVQREVFWSQLRLILQAFYRFDWQSTHRILPLFEFTEKLRDHYCPSPHWYLDGLAVTPESQGRGVGKLLLEPVLGVADREGQACCLYTSTERAVRFYERQGFTVCEQARLQTEAPPLWFMVRLPKGSK
ncbi:MAG: GNAT family N-acetyltransferase [Pseudanabaenaceae cyanobacterium bins.68]|nr:GNAT family N-acetyltransferase [Pseudanabaenaceae cyanobacterium bins.68]